MSRRRIVDDANNPLFRMGWFPEMPRREECPNGRLKQLAPNHEVTPSSQTLSSHLHQSENPAQEWSNTGRAHNCSPPQSEVRLAARFVFLSQVDLRR